MTESLSSTELYELLRDACAGDADCLRSLCEAAPSRALDELLQDENYMSDLAVGVAEALLQAGASVEGDASSETPFFNAVALCWVEMVELLVRHGASRGRGGVA